MFRSGTVKMEAVCFSEKLVPTYQTIRYHHPEAYNLNRHGRETPKSLVYNSMAFYPEGQTS
jgi:hypothetical protein